MPAPPEADRNDVDGVHPRRRPPDPLQWRRRRDAADARNHGLQRDARRDRVRHLPDARLLLRHRLAGLDPRLPPAAGGTCERRRAGNPYLRLFAPPDPTRATTTGTP